MSEKWYYGRDGKQEGPVTSRKLKELAENGELRPDDLVWKEGLSDWVAAKKVKGLIPKGERIDSSMGVIPASSGINTVVVSCGSCKARYKVNSASIVAGRVRCKACSNPILVEQNSQNGIEFPIPLKVVSSRPLIEEEIQIVRQRLSAVAHQIPHHDVDDFGAAIELSNSLLIPCYSVELHTLYEDREVKRQDAPYAGHSIPVLKIDEDNIRPWDYQFLSKTDFEEHEDKLDIDESQSVHDCGKCRKTGKVTCPDCEGVGEVCCPDCSGSTIVSCPQCKGRGVVKQERQVPGEEHCYYCFGSGIYGGAGAPAHQRCHKCYGRGFTMGSRTEYYEVPCTCCGSTGQVHCGTCRASGVVTCSTCDGETLVTCDRCEGRTQIVSFLTIVRTLRPGALSNMEFDGQLSEETKALLVQKLEEPFEMPTVETVDDIAVSVEMEQLPNANGVASLRSAVRKLLFQASRIKGEERKIIRQSISIHQNVAAAFRYIFRGQEYEGCLLGRELTVLPFRNPFSDLAESSFKTAIRLWQEGKTQQSIEQLILSRAIARKDEVAQKMLNDNSEQIPVGLKTAAAASSMMVSARAGILRGATAVSEKIDAVKNSKFGKWLGKLKEGGDLRG